MKTKERVVAKLEGNGEWKLIGRVGVDSGQLMVCDPCYIESQWKQKDVDYSNKLIVVKTGKEIKKPTGFNGLKWSDIYKPLKMAYNKAIEKGLLKETQIEETREFSYDGCCKETINKSYGQLNFEMGHAGAGVVFSSGFGDGCYKVWALFKDYKDLGKRIKEVKIILIDDEDE